MNAASLLRFRLLFVLLGLLLVASCKDDSASGTVATKGFGDYFSIGVGAKNVRLQLAIHPIEQQQGLMHRTDFGADDGMVFVYKKPQSMSYWMRNTPTALDIGYFDSAGILLEVYPMLPFDETPVRSRSDRIQYAVEMHRGWYQANKVRPGDKLKLDQLGEALKQRGLAPSEFGIGR